MRKLIIIAAVLILLCGISSEKVVEGKEISSLNETNNETVTLPNLNVYAGNVYGNTTGTVLDNWCWKERKGNCSMGSTSPSELLNGIPPLKVKQGKK
ncbi:hypothetical protein [Lentibacillus sp. Marseille-P4043]|uniref:hypothetical protein n=1 Tax=Lentibacillus sp. Marseille-P4043 TaxID=2040293 RepID=UPI000D0B1AF9|nr:hypothetical protein [Lentibacillus sp. Marseille-P4043]